ncbi:alginate lyase family protein [Undibacterium oligocarboniphilum]|nr:alginate lyase family protein [Undibacterium oligocarboniphilum]MBC3869054.1 alginate lyase family protein [Undibacterium oligocarboniphilum]
MILPLGTTMLVHAQMPAEQPLFITSTQIQALQQQPERWTALQKRCDTELDTRAQPVADFSPAPHYSSTGITHDTTAKNLSTDAGIIYRAALCYQLTTNRAYASHAQTMIDAWSKTVKTVDKGQGASDFNFNLPQIIIGASLVRGVNDWDDTTFRALLTDKAAATTHADKANNHGNWGVLLDASIAAYLGNTQQLAKTSHRWQALMQSQVADDGSLPLEICRSNTNNYCGGADQGINGLSYTHYTLLPTAVAAEILALRGFDVYQGDAGRKLGLAYARAARWTRYPDTFPYYQSNDGKLNGIRNAAYFSILQKHYPNPDADTVLREGKVGMNGLELLMLFTAD